jgi:hypothetical protein
MDDRQIANCAFGSGTVKQPRCIWFRRNIEPTALLLDVRVIWRARKMVPFVIIVIRVQTGSFVVVRHIVSMAVRIQRREFG